MEQLEEFCPSTVASVPDSVPESGAEYGAYVSTFTSVSLSLPVYTWGCAGSTCLPTLKDSIMWDMF